MLRGCRIIGTDIRDERLRRSGARRDTGWFGMIEERSDMDEPSEKGH